MLPARSRREFLKDVGKGMLIAAVGTTLAADLKLANAREIDENAPLNFGQLEELVALMQETPVARLNVTLIDKLKSGVDLKTLIAAGALANARTFGGEDYVGFHTMMALAPAYRMSQELSADLAPLPVLKVLYRNTNRIQEHGARKGEVLQIVEPSSSVASPVGDTLRAAVRGKKTEEAERIFARIAQGGADEAFNAVLEVVEDNTEVHRVVLPYRAWDMLDLIGREQAHTLLRQSVRYCIKAETWARNATWDQPRQLLPALLEKYKLLERKPGETPANEAFVQKLSLTIFESTPEQSAEAAASALAEGFAPDVVGEAISLAANQLILRDHGRTPREESSGKPIGSVHGDSIGVHACDSANAWRNMARVANARNMFACLILGAYQVALDRVNRGGEFLKWEPLPLKQQIDGVKTEDAAALIAETDVAIRGNLQSRAAALVARYGQLNHPSRAMFELMLKYAVSEDGALHAEKFYRTSSEEFSTTRPAFRWRYLVALARVTASEYGRPAAGVGEAREMLKV